MRYRCSTFSSSRNCSLSPISHNQHGAAEFVRCSIRRSIRRGGLSRTGICRCKFAKQTANSIKIISRFRFDGFFHPPPFAVVAVHRRAGVHLGDLIFGVENRRLRECSIAVVDFKFATVRELREWPSRQIAHCPRFPISPIVPDFSRAASEARTQAETPKRTGDKANAAAWRDGDRCFRSKQRHTNRK